MLLDTTCPFWFFPFLIPLFLGLFAVGVSDLFSLLAIITVYCSSIVRLRSLSFRVFKRPYN